MKVLYFAQAAQSAGCREELWELEAPISVSEFWEEAVQRHPALEVLKGSCRLAADMDFVEANSTLAPSCEVAVMPPVSGG